MPYYPDLEGESIPVNFARVSYESAKSLGVLLLQHHNATSKKAEVVLINPTFQRYLPIITNVEP